MNIAHFIFTVFAVNAAICAPVARNDASSATTGHPTAGKQKQMPFGMAGFGMPGFGGFGAVPGIGGMGIPGLGGMPLGGVGGGGGSLEWMYGLGYANGVQGANAAAQGR